VGGQAAGLARAERALGLDSVAVALEQSPFGYAMDEVLRAPGRSRLAFERDRWQLVLRAARDFDVIHFNFGRTIMPPPPRGAASPRYRLYARLLGLSDLRLLDRLGKLIAVTFQGDDARQGDVLRARYERSVADANPGNYGDPGDRAKRRIVAAFDRHADVLFYLNPDLGWVLPGRARFLPYASVDLSRWSPLALESRARPLVAHAPSDRLTKGTAHVLAAVESLRSQGVRFDFELVEGVTRDEACEVYKRADIFIDQLHVGWYGAAAVELMALAKPVMCFLRIDDFVHLPQELVAEIPIVNVEPSTLADRLRELILAPLEVRAEVGRRSRAYVARWHDPLAVARTTADLYERGLAGLRL
jgi:hypothetical protein